MPLLIRLPARAFYLAAPRQPRGTARFVLERADFTIPKAPGPLECYCALPLGDGDEPASAHLFYIDVASRV